MYIINELKQILGEQNVKQNEEMSKHTSFRTGGKADIFVKIENIDNLKAILQLSKKEKFPYFILGNGSNILVTDKGIRGIVCKINICKFEIKEESEDIFITCRSTEIKLQKLHKDY